MKGKRFFAAFAGVVAMLFVGFVYAWSMLSGPISADFPQWNNAQLSITFTICMAFFCLGGIVSGLLAKKFPVRYTVMAAAALFLVGFLLTSRTQNLLLLYISYGVLCGTAAGFVYNSTLNALPQWFPGRQGLISGVLLMGFGAGSMAIGAVFTAVTPLEAGGWRTTLFVFGILWAAVLLVCSFFIAPPKAGELPAAQTAAEDGDELSPRQMLRRMNFWLLFLWACALAAVGLAVISQARPMALAARPDMDLGVISVVVGAISVCNGAGRVLFGAIYDKLGQRRTMLFVNLCFLLGVGLLAAALAGASFLLIPGFVCTGLAYGGVPTMAAAVSKQFFGKRNYAVNLSILNINLMVASFSSAAAGAIYDRMGGYSALFLLLFAFTVVAFLTLLGLRRAKRA